MQAIASGIGSEAAFTIDTDQAAASTQARELLRSRAQVIGTIKRDAGKRRCETRAHTANELPQPQVVLALGLRMMNCAPLSDSL